MSEPSDPDEQEADRVAEMVLQMHDPGADAVAPAQEGSQLGVQRLCAECEEEQALQRTCRECAAEQELRQVVPSSGGDALPVTVRRFFEPRFGYDFSAVRIHVDAAAAEAAQTVNARAYTVGRDIIFGAGEYAPGTSEGTRLLAHELAHVVQQGTEWSPMVAREAERPVARELVTREDYRVLTPYDECQPSIARQATVPRPGGAQQASPSVDEVALAEHKHRHLDVVERMHTRYLINLERNARNARAANQRFIEFEEDAINQLRTIGTIARTAAPLFGGPSAVIGLCIIILTEVAARRLSGKAAKIAAAAAGVDAKLTQATTETDATFDELRDRIENMASFDWPAWAPIWNTMANVGVPEIAPENIVYRDLLLQLAQQGGYNVSGSEWNVRNMSLFGHAAWYQSWDWGSPGWTNGQDIADALNSLAVADPSTRITVRINPP